MSTLQNQQPIVVGIDGSPEALGALRWAAVEAKRRGKSVRLVTAVDWTEERVVGLPALGREYGEIVREQAGRSLAEAVAAAKQLAPEVDVDQELLTGFPIGSLVAESRHAGLLVVGGAGSGRFESLMAGSVAVGVASHAVGSTPTYGYSASSATVVPLGGCSSCRRRHSSSWSGRGGMVSWPGWCWAR